MFGIGFTELLIILIIALMVVGPDRLPELGRQMGTFVREIRRMYGNLRSELGPEFDEIEQGIRELRSLDPRQQMRDYGRALLDDLGTEVPDMKDLAYTSRADLEAATRHLLRDDLLDRPLNETLKRPVEGQQPTPPTPGAHAAVDPGQPQGRSEAAVEPAGASTAAPDSTVPPGDPPPYPIPPGSFREIETTGHYE